MEEIQSVACEVCGGTGWQIVVENGISRAKRCGCSRTTFTPEKAFASARIPSRYISCELDNYLPDSKFFNTQGRAKKLALEYVTDYPMLDAGLFGEGSLLFTGPAGLGKTHLSASILKGLVRKGVPCLFIDFHELLLEIRESYDPLAQMSEMQILRPIINIEVLLLDDLGSRRMTEWMQDTVFHIINLRYNQKRTLIATTNLAMEPSGASTHETLQDRLGYPVVSRLYEMCKVIELNGPDYRKPSEA